MKQFFRLSLVALVVAGGFAMQVSRADAQVYSSDPSQIPNVSLTINGVAQAISLTQTSTPGLYDINSSALGDGTANIPVADPGDPILGFAFGEPPSGSLPNGAAPPGGNYQLTFTLPNQSIGPGPAQASATLGLTLTDIGSTSASIYPYLTSAIQTSTLVNNTSSLDAGVDIGSSFSTNPGTTTAPFSANNTLQLNQSYNEMLISVSFTVDPNTYVSGTGSFSVLTAPEPSTWAFLIGGVSLLLVSMRRRNI